MNKETLEKIYKQTILDNPYIPVNPTPKQTEFLLDFGKETLYGGAAGGGKSYALLMAALMFVAQPGYRALILRRNYSQLTLPNALIDVAHEWLDGTDAKWCAQKKQWTFPSGATLNFGYLDSEVDKYRYQGAAFHFVGFDELTQFTRSQYTYLFSRMRRPEGLPLPLRFRSTSNPGGVGHEWVKERFIDPVEGNKLFIPAGLGDNPHIDSEDYRQSLEELDPVTRAQLRDGDWEIIADGNFFRRENFRMAEDSPPDAQSVRYWDIAGSEEGRGRDPDYTAGVRMCRKGGIYWITDVIRVRLSPAEVERLIRHTAQMDGISTEIFMEQEPGSSGLSMVDHYARNVLQGFCFRPVRSTGSKIERAKPFSAAVDNGNVRLVRGTWNTVFIDECSVFPQRGWHDDQVDAASGAFNQLQRGTMGRIETKPVDRSSKTTRGYDI